MSDLLRALAVCFGMVGFVALLIAIGAGVLQMAVEKLMGD